MENKNIKPTIINYGFHKINNFEEVHILKKEYGYVLFYKVNHPTGTNNYIELKQAIVGMFAFLNDEHALIKLYKTFDSYDECIEIIQQRDGKTFDKLFNEGKVFDSRILLSIKQNKL